MTGDGDATAWTAVLPLKRLPRAKTRLRGALAGVDHERLVLAMALDTVAAVHACPGVARVLVVTDDPTARPFLAGLGAECVPGEPAGGINAALALGAAVARGASRTHGAALATGASPTHGAALATGASPTRERTPIVALTADLPALDTAELAEALRAAALLAGAEPFRGFLSDAAGTGTSLLVALGGAALSPRFGPDSAAAHAASGAVPLTAPADAMSNRATSGAVADRATSSALPGVRGWSTLRRDVDTAADLVAAAALGLGPHTATLAGYRDGVGNEAARSAQGTVAGSVQGTVATFEAGTGAGTVLLDDGTELAFPGEAFARSGLRLLRLGQRVRLDRDASGGVSKVTLPTLG